DLRGDRREERRPPAAALVLACREHPDAFRRNARPDRAGRKLPGAMGPGDEIAAAEAIFPAVAEIDAVVEGHLQPAGFRPVADADLLDADHRPRILGGGKASGLAHRAVEAPVVAADDGTAAVDGPDLRPDDVVRPEEIGRIEAVRVGVDLLRPALLDDPAVLQEKDVVGGGERLA